MAHHIYNTQGFVIVGQNSGEANKYFIIFTRDLGMIQATAQGVRLLKSKLRYSLQDFAYSRLSLVRGKDIWRITNARSEINLFDRFKGTDSIKIIARIFSLLKRLVRGEEKNEALFENLDKAFDFLVKDTLNFNQTIGFEYIVVLNILYHLGYLAPTSLTKVYIDPVWNDNLLEKLEKEKREIVQEINKSLKETQL